MSLPIYLDYNATTPIHPEAAEAMKPFLTGFFGNPSSGHRYGVQARKAVEVAREQVAELLHCEPDEVVFTSGGSESNNTALRGTALALRDEGRHIITTAVEHPAISEVCNHLRQEGFRVTVLPVDRYGQVSAAQVEAAIRPDTILVSVMHANNEVGTLQPIAEIARRARARGILTHSDCAQAVGKIPTDMQALGVDLYSLAGHKLYAPKGVGALFVRRGTRLARFIHGASHEQGRRAGTENVLGLAGLGVAARVALRDLEENMRHLRAMRDRLHEGIRQRVPDVHLNGHPHERLPNTLSLSFPGVEANAILDEMTDIAASAGAACHADQVDISTVLVAMEVPEHIAMGTIRFSTGRGNTAEEMDRAAERVAQVVSRLRGEEAPGVTTLQDGPIRLTHFTHGLGCACKLRPQVLETVLAGQPLVTDPAVLVGTEHSDDAAIYRLRDDLAVVGTVDFFTPIVDDPYTFGAIAAANSLSDVYAMGARPLFALNLVGFPSRRLPLHVLHDMLRGAADKCAEAGVPIIGGHSVDDTEPRYGLAITGTVHPDRILRNGGTRPGDALILTKPIGTGILATAAKRGLITPDTVALMARVMAELNRAPAEAMAAWSINACTDITGFGLLGHLREMTRSSGVDAQLWVQAVPTLPEALTWARAGVVPGGSRDNLEFVACDVDWDDHISQVERLLLCDAQTSGGLLIALPEAEAQELLVEIKERGVSQAAIIGRITGAGTGRVHVVRQLDVL